MNERTKLRLFFVGIMIIFGLDSYLSSIGW